MKRTDKVIAVPIYDIITNTGQPRKHFNDASLLSLAASIKENGIIQPLTVKRCEKEKEKYFLIAGERRLRAAKIAFITEVPCIVVEADTKQAAVISLTENIQRENLNFFEEAIAIEQLCVNENLTREHVAKKLGKAQCTVANKLRLLKLSKQEMDFIINFGLTERHARALLRIEDRKTRMECIKMIAEKDWNVSQTEKYINSLQQVENKDMEKKKKIFIVKDVRLFLNTINKAVETMKKAGIAAKTDRKESEDFLEYTIRIPVMQAEKEKQPQQIDLFEKKRQKTA